MKFWVIFLMKVAKTVWFSVLPPGGRSLLFGLSMPAPILRLIEGEGMYLSAAYPPLERISLSVMVLTP